MLGRNIFVLAGIGVLAAVLLVFAVVPMLSASTPEDEIEAPTPVPSREEMPVFDEGYHSNAKDDWFPRNLPATGTPHLVVAEMENRPLAEIYPEGGGRPALTNQVNYSEAPWIHASMENDSIPTKMDDKSLAEFYAFYDKQDAYTPYFEVTFPDGSVKYYDVRLIEVP